MRIFRLFRFWSGRRRRWLVAGLASLALLTGLAFYWSFCNIPRHSLAWTTERLDPAIHQGLDFLARSSAFAKPFDQDGEHAIHHYLLDQILSRQPHAVLRRQRDYCDRVNQRIPRWRAFAGLPGWPEKRLDQSIRAEVELVIREYDNPYGRWLLWATQASWATLPKSDRRCLFDDTSLLRSSYDLTHALMTYWILERAAPDQAARLKVEDHVKEILPRVKRLTAWAPRCSDSYHERVAFSLMFRPTPNLSRRWIERIIETENPDGGWTFEPRYSRTLLEMFGRPLPPERSQAHSTLLAVLALVYYRDSTTTSARAPARQMDGRDSGARR